MRVTSTGRVSSRLIANAASTVSAAVRAGRGPTTSVEKIGALRAVWASSSKTSNAATVAKVGSLRMPPPRCGARLLGVVGSHAFSSHPCRVSTGTSPT